jgi:hypothetical protein
MSDEPKKRRWAWIGWVVGLLLVLVGYPLSTGPAYRMAFSSDMDHARCLNTLCTIYKPIGWLRAHSDSGRACVDRYMAVWGLPGWLVE